MSRGLGGQACPSGSFGEENRLATLKAVRRLKLRCQLDLHPLLGQGILWNLFTAFDGLLGSKVSRVDDDGP